MKPLNEKTPPGMEDWVKKHKAEFKKNYGKDWASYLYGTAWKMHNSNESTDEVDESGAGGTGGAMTTPQTQRTYARARKVSEEYSINIEGEDDRPDEDYDPEQLAMGIEVEMEHTDDEDLAKIIAKDHLDEIPRYYDPYLLDMEEKAKKELDEEQVHPDDKIGQDMLKKMKVPSYFKSNKKGEVHQKKVNELFALKVKGTDLYLPKTPYKILPGTEEYELLTNNPDRIGKYKFRGYAEKLARDIELNPDDVPPGHAPLDNNIEWEIVELNESNFRDILKPVNESEYSIFVDSLIAYFLYDALKDVPVKKWPEYFARNSKDIIVDFVKFANNFGYNIDTDMLNHKLEAVLQKMFKNGGRVNEMNVHPEDKIGKMMLDRMGLPLYFKSGPNQETHQLDVTKVNKKYVGKENTANQEHPNGTDGNLSKGFKAKKVNEEMDFKRGQSTSDALNVGVKNLNDYVEQYLEQYDKEREEPLELTAEEFWKSMEEDLYDAYARGWEEYVVGLLKRAPLEFLGEIQQTLKSYIDNAEYMDEG